MKIFRIGKSLLIMMICLNFFSCSRDEYEEPAKDEDIIVPKEKKLKQIKYRNATGAFIYDFNYDEKNRVTVIIRTNENAEGQILQKHVTNYTWKANSIVNENNGSVYILDNNRVTTIYSFDNYIYECSYDKGNHLIRLQDVEDPSWAELWEWSGEKMLEYADNNGDSEKFIYNGKGCNGYLPIFLTVFRLYEDDIFYAHPELIGIRSSQLPDKSEYVAGDEPYFSNTTMYNYTFDENGYVTNCTITNRDNSGKNNMLVYTFTWQ